MIKCTQCGGKYLDGADECPHCGCITYEKENTIQNNQYEPKCPNCGSTDVVYEREQETYVTKGKSEVRKKSVVTRKANKAGRKAMIVATGGLWALTPKKSDYNEISKDKTKIKYTTYGICQSCGHSWKRGLFG